MTRKKILLVIVEGPSDETALGYALSQVYDTDEEKENDAYDFAAKYKGNVEGFLHFMCESNFSVDGEYKDSWKYIETGLHSLERHSNLSVCLREEKDRLEKRSLENIEEDR